MIEMLAFKSLLHQNMQMQFGQVYGALPIDLIHYDKVKKSAAKPAARVGEVEVVLRVMSDDADMVMQTLPLLTAVGGVRCTVTTLAKSAHLQLLSKYRNKFD